MWTAVWWWGSSGTCCVFPPSPWWTPTLTVQKTPSALTHTSSPRVSTHSATAVSSARDTCPTEPADVRTCPVRHADLVWLLFPLPWCGAGAMAQFPVSLHTSDPSPPPIAWRDACVMLLLCSELRYTVSEGNCSGMPVIAVCLCLSWFSQGLRSCVSTSTDQWWVCVCQLSLHCVRSGVACSVSVCSQYVIMPPSLSLSTKPKPTIHLWIFTVNWHLMEWKRWAIVWQMSLLIFCNHCSVY